MCESDINLFLPPPTLCANPILLFLVRRSQIIKTVCESDGSTQKAGNPLLAQQVSRSVGGCSSLGWYVRIRYIFSLRE